MYMGWGYVFLRREVESMDVLGVDVCGAYGE